MPRYLPPLWHGVQKFELSLSTNQILQVIKEILTLILVLLWMMLVRPLKAPEKMKRMLVVSTSMVFFPLPLRSGTLMTAPSIIFRRLCCTPSPPTSRWNWPPFLELILSTSSKNTIPEWWKETFIMLQIHQNLLAECVWISFQTDITFLLSFNNYLIKSWRYLSFFLSV